MAGPARILALRTRTTPSARAAVGEELADCLCYLLAMANALNIDLSNAVRGKMLKNAQKYPADQYRGRWGAGDTRGAGEF